MSPINARFEHLQKTVGTSPRGQSWLGRLPALIDAITNQWLLTVSEEVTTDATASWVARCITAGAQEVVLKIGFPHAEARDEIPGLIAWQEHGAVPLIDHDVGTYAILMTPCKPGTTLRHQPEPYQDTIIAATLQRLWSVQPDAIHPFRNLSEMIELWISEQSPERQADALAQQGTETYRRMLATTRKQVLMPTDLHAGNILSHGDNWTLIDPKPYIGDPTYDITQHLLNCRRRLREDPLGLIRRMAGLTDQDPVRIRSWLFARLACASDRTTEDTALAERLRPTSL